jgi:hypothetical protein
VCAAPTHTTSFTKRKAQHKYCCTSILISTKYNGNVYKFIRANGNWNNWDMIEIEKFPCVDKIEACKRERHYIETLKSILNTQMPLRTDAEYYESNKEVIKEKGKKYYDKIVKQLNK